VIATGTLFGLKWGSELSLVGADAGAWAGALGELLLSESVGACPSPGLSATAESPGLAFVSAGFPSGSSLDVASAESELPDALSWIAEVESLRLNR
jgi:hypothetical protein